MSSSQAVVLPDSVERLTWTEICDRYPERWVVLANIYRQTTAFEFEAAAVIAAFESRKDASPTVRAILARNDVAACFWTGELRLRSPWFMQ
jgi:hypothetical protein